MSTHPTATTTEPGGHDQTTTGQQYQDLGPGSFAGNLTRDPELRYTNNGRAVCAVRLANTPREWDKSSRVWVDLPTEYADVQCWAKAAENVVENLVRGDRVVAHGNWQMRRWTDGQGQQQERRTLIARDIGPSMLFAAAVPVRAGNRRRQG